MKQSSRDEDFKTNKADRFQILMEEYGTKHNLDGGFLSQTKVAQSVHISESTLSRKINGDTEFTEIEILRLSEFFGVSCDEIITGRKHEDRTAVKTYGFSQRTLDRLKLINETEPNLIHALNIILENDFLTNSILRMLLMYAEAPKLKFSPLVSNDPGEFGYIDAETGDKVIKSLLRECLELTMDAFKYFWEKRIFIKYPKIRFTQSQVRGMKKKLSEESRHRLKRKRIAIRIQPQTIEDYYRLKDEMAKYVLFRYHAGRRTAFEKKTEQYKKETGKNM